MPVSTVAYLTLPRELNGDGAALFSMFRNVFGSIGISMSTAQITQRSQVHQTYLSQWATPFHQPFQALIATYEQALRAMGRVGSAAHDIAVGRVYQVFRTQIAVLAYSDVFYYCAIGGLSDGPVLLCAVAEDGRRARRGRALMRIRGEAGYLVAVIAPLLLAGCMVGPDFVQPDSHLPEQSFYGDKGPVNPGAPLPPPTDPTWWAMFRDPMLTELESRVAEANLDVQTATVRLAQSRFQRGVAGICSIPIDQRRRQIHSRIV